MDCKITPSFLKGEINVPSSKSYCHRYILNAALCKGKSLLSNITFSKDIYATLEGVKSLGASYEIKGNNVEITGISPQNKEIIVDCNESGSTLRFLIPILTVLKDNVMLTGKERLFERPLTPYLDIFDKNNINYELGKTYIKINGTFKNKKFVLPGDVSSQFVTGMIYAGVLLNEDIEICISSNLESKPYVDMTLKALKDFGIDIKNSNYNSFFIRKGQGFKEHNISIEGDYSQGAFFLVGNFLGNDITLSNLNNKSIQGDKKIFGIIKEFKKPGYIKTDVSQIPDLVPILSVAAALRDGETLIYGAKRLRLKESDRLKAITNALKNLGANISEGEDHLKIKGKSVLNGGVIDSVNDHRIAMACAIASTRCKNCVIIKDSQCVEKSYPNFWEDFVKLGGKISLGVF